MNKERAGFTFLEIMTVVIIAAILVAIAFPVFRSTIEKSREKIALTNLKLILAGENLYRLSYDHYYDPDTDPAGDEEWQKINRVLNLDIEPKYFSYDIRAEDNYRFKIYAIDQAGQEIYYIDQEGVVKYLK